MKSKHGIPKELPGAERSGEQVWKVALKPGSREHIRTLPVGYIKKLLDILGTYKNSIVGKLLNFVFKSLVIEMSFLVVEIIAT